MAVQQTRFDNIRRNIAVVGLALCLFVPLSFKVSAMEADSSTTIEADMVLSELNHLADELEKQRKFSRILLKKIDEMQGRIDQLEAGISDQSSKAPGDETPDNKADKGSEHQQDEKSLSDEFEQFLDMGETMLRRFFGVVKEFRKEFEDNQA